jgi:hypothetical protein
MKSILTLHNLNAGSDKTPYQYYLNIFNYDDEDLDIITSFLYELTGGVGYAYGDYWWYSDVSHRIYLKEKDLAFFLIKFGDRMSPLADH